MRLGVVRVYVRKRKKLAFASGSYITSRYRGTSNLSPGYVTFRSYLGFLFVRYTFPN